MSSKPIYKNVRGSPYKINDIVRIVKLSDGTGNKKLLGKIGRIVYFEYSCGCGQSYPVDPMIGILFDNGILEEFWKEELTKVTKIKIK